MIIGQHSNGKIHHLVDDSTLTRLVIPDSATEQIQLISKDEFEKINPVQLIMNDEEINEVLADEKVSTPS